MNDLRPAKRTRASGPAPDWMLLPTDLWRHIADLAEGAEAAESSIAAQDTVSEASARLKIHLALGGTCRALRRLLAPERRAAMICTASAIVGLQVSDALYDIATIRDPYREPVRAVLQLALETYDAGVVRAVAELLEVAEPQRLRDGVAWLRRAACLMECTCRGAAV